jgi:hypothetical protein
MMAMTTSNSISVNACFFSLALNFDDTKQFLIVVIDIGSVTQPNIRISHRP